MINLQRRRLVALGGLALFLTACSTPRQARHDALMASQRFAAKGYDRGENLSFDVSVHEEHWPIDKDFIKITALLPTTAPNPPVIVYQAADQASDSAGEYWRKTWARAGYAVFSTANPTALSFGERQARCHVILALLDQRGSNGMGVAAHVDRTRVGLAGYGSGAQGALAVVGERDVETPAEPATACPQQIRAVIAFSPPVNVAKGGLAKRYGSIATPVLSITGNGSPDFRPGPPDLDRQSMDYANPLNQQAAFHFMPAGQKYLLAIDGASPRQLAGDQARPGEDDPPLADSGELPRGRPNEGGGRSGPGGGMRGPPSGMGGPPSGKERAPRGSSFKEFGREFGRQSPFVTVVAEQVSIAFLDATLREDGIAREWLDRNAEQWLSAFARLERK